MVLNIVLVGCTPAFTHTSNATASVTPSNSTPEVGEQITMDINIDVSGVASPDQKLGSYTGTLHWDPAVLIYKSYTGAPPTGFTGVVNIDQVAAGQIGFNGASASGSTGKITICHVTFEVIGSGMNVLDLRFTAMAAAETYADLLPILTINNGAVEVPAASAGSLSHVVEFGNTATMQQPYLLSYPFPLEEPGNPSSDAPFSGCSL